MRGGQGLLGKAAQLAAGKLLGVCVGSQVPLDDIHHGGSRHEVVHHALKRHQGARQHGHRARQLDSVLLRHGDQRTHEGANVQVRKVGRAKVRHDGVQVGEQVRLVHLSAVGYGEAHEAVRQARGVLLGNRDDHVREGAAVARGEPAHDAQVHVDDPAAGNHDVSRVGVGVEEAVVQHLGGKVVHELLADLRAVVAGCGQGGCVVDGDALHVVHDHHVAGAQGRVGLGALQVDAAGVVAAELLEVSGLHQEVRLLTEGLPELVHNGLQVKELVLPHEAAHVAREGPHDGDVLRHGLLHVGALDLDGHELARDQARLVHLGHRGRAQRIVVYSIEDILDGTVVLGAQGREHGVSVHGLHVRAQALQLAREARRQDLGPHGEDLARLDEGGAQLLEHAPQRLGREAVEDVVAAHDGQHLPNAPQLRAARGSLRP